jgi:hypothetical protein
MQDALNWLVTAIPLGIMALGAGKISGARLTM